MDDRIERRKSQYVIAGAPGGTWGPFDDAGEAARWAISKWPDAKRDEGDGDGWIVAVLHSPDESSNL